jgi:MFS family permease
MLVFACVALAPWPIVVIGFWGQLIATMAFGVLLDRIGRRSGMLLIVGAVVAITFNTESSFALATVPLGFAWLAVGAEAVLRRQVAAGVASS